MRPVPRLYEHEGVWPAVWGQGRFGESIVNCRTFEPCLKDEQELFVF